MLTTDLQLIPKFRIHAFLSPPFHTCLYRMGIRPSELYLFTLYTYRYIFRKFKSFKNNADISANIGLKLRNGIAQ
jgi:hypothetical protein